MSDATDLTHIDDQGRARMVNVGDKPRRPRRAVVEGFFVAESATLDRLMAGDLPKGEALGVARIAGIAAAKRTDEWIPLRYAGRTGVEMESLCAVSAACLTLYDMTKAVDRNLSIEGVRLVSKEKGEPVE